MSALNQKTLNEKINFSGVGLHSGKIAKVCIKPSEPNTGIVFKRVDLENNNLLTPNFANVSNTSLNTTISNEFDFFFMKPNGLFLPNTIYFIISL